MEWGLTALVAALLKTALKITVSAVCLCGSEGQVHMGLCY